MNSHRTNNTSPRGLQRPQRQAEKPDYLHDSPTNVYFLSLSVVFSLRCKPWPDDQSCYQNEGSEPENYTCQSSVKNEITAECAGICPKGYPFLSHFFSKYEKKFPGVFHCSAFTHGCKP